MPNGKAAKRIRGPEGLDQEFNPKRRSALWTVGDALVKTNKGCFTELYHRALREFVEKHPGVKSIQYYGRKVNKTTGKEYDSYSQHVRNHANRIVVKRLIRELRKAWDRLTPLADGTFGTLESNEEELGELVSV